MIKIKENIYTIPIIEAFEESNICPFCYIREKLNNESINYVLGPSYMEEDIREVTDKKGFCPQHFEELFHEQNRLGLSLMSHTHLKKLIATIDDKYTEPKKALFKKNEDNTELLNFLKEVNSSCYICDKIDNTFYRYVDSFFYLIKKNDEFYPLFEKTSFFCLDHFELLLKTSNEKLNGEKKINFSKTLMDIQRKYMKELEEDLDWFIKKYDYRYKDEPYKNSKDSLNRSIGFLGGKYLNDK